MAEDNEQTFKKEGYKPKESPKDRRFRRGKGKKARRRHPVRGTKFIGNTEDLGEHVYDIGYNQSDQYTTTTREISHHVGHTYKNGADVKRSIDGLTQLLLAIPVDHVYPDKTTQAKLSP